jgi:hypothetical protein
MPKGRKAQRVTVPINPKRKSAKGLPTPPPTNPHVDPHIGQLKNDQYVNVKKTCAAEEDHAMEVA